MDNVVRIEELADCVERTILEVQKGIAAARQNGGILVELPKEIQFTMTVVQSWQVLDVSGGQTAETFEEQGGGNKEVTRGFETTEQATKGTQAKIESSREVHGGKTTTSDEQRSENSEKRIAREGGMTGDSSERTTSGTTTQENAHNQKDVETYTYVD